MSPYDIIPLVVVVLSLAGIVFVIVRKFPVLAAINIQSIKSEQEAAKKEKIIASRLERKITGAGRFLVKVVSPIGIFLVNFFRKIYDQARKWEKKYIKRADKKIIAPDEAVQKIKTLFFSVDEDIKAEKFDLAEQKCVEIIALDHKNIEAYKKLGFIYVEQKNYSNAEATFEHILKLYPDDVETVIDMGAMYKEQGENTKALEKFKRAVELEPANPKNLDFLIDISIIVGNKELAEENFKKLAEVNPENQKLAEFKERIKSL